MITTRNVRRIAFLVVGSLLLLGMGCAPAWTVVRESGPPSALQGATAIGVVFDYSQFVVEGMPEDNWVEKKTAKEDDYADKTWPELIGAWETNFMNGFRDNWGAVSLLNSDQEAPESTVVATVQVLSLDMGKLVPFATRPSVVATAIIWTVGGEDGDEIRVRVEENPTLISVSVFQHVRSIGKQIGAIAADFLETKK